RYPHTLPVFPYTTLFRSLVARWLEAFYIAMDDRKVLSPLYSGLRNTIPRPVFLGTKTPTPPPNEQEAIVGGGVGVFVPRKTGLGDRKSTRLNSSHRTISY